MDLGGCNTEDMKKRNSLKWIIPIFLWAAFYIVLGGVTWRTLGAALIAASVPVWDKIIDEL